MIRKSLFISLVLIGTVLFQPITMAAENDSTVDNLIANYVNNAYLASTLVNTAGQYVWDRNYGDAEKLYHAVIEIHPNNPYATKARVGLARLDVLNLIAEKKWSLAQQRVELMAADFNNEPDLAVSLFHIGKEYAWQHRYSEAKETFDVLLKQPLNDSFSQEAKLWLARIEVCLLIGQARDEEIVASTDKLISDFEGNAGLPEAIYWISKEYEWKKSAGEDRNGWYDAPNSVFQRLIQQFGNSSFGIDAEWDQKRLSHRMKIFKLMQGPNQAVTDAAIEAMAAEFEGQPELADELLWIACGYEERPNKSRQAKQMYQRLIQDFPEIAETKHLVLHNRRMDIHILIESADINKAVILTDKLCADFNSDSELSNALYLIGRHYYNNANALNGQEGPDKDVRMPLQEAVKSWQRLAELPTSEFTAVGIYAMADCHYRLGDFNMAILCHKKIVTEFPEYKNAYISLYMIAHCYDKLASAGKVPMNDAKQQVRGRCEELIERYPDCKLVSIARKLMLKWNID